MANWGGKNPTYIGSVPCSLVGPFRTQKKSTERTLTQIPHVGVSKNRATPKSSICS